MVFDVKHFFSLDNPSCSLLPELQRLVSRAESSWDSRFAVSVHSYHSAQHQIITSRSNSALPDLETYLPLRRSLSGLYILLDLVELSENMQISLVDAETRSKLETLRQLTADIIGCSLVHTFPTHHFNIFDRAQTGCFRLQHRSGPGEPL